MLDIRLIEGLALASFAQIRDNAQNPLAAAVNAYVMQDEARHVAFGRLALRDYYPQLSDKERDEREEFLLEASYLMRDRFDAVEVWKNLGLDPVACGEHMYHSGFMATFRNSLFQRIVPIVKDVGLWGPRIRKGYEEMGVLGYALRKFEFDPAPLVLGLVIAPIFEQSLRQSLIMSNGDYMIFFQRPISAGLLTVSVILLGLSALSLIMARRDWRAKLAEAEAGEPTA